MVSLSSCEINLDIFAVSANFRASGAWRSFIGQEMNLTPLLNRYPLLMVGIAALTPPYGSACNNILVCKKSR